MAYNSPFPATYNTLPYGYQQPQLNPQAAVQMPIPQIQNGIIWVQGEEGAKSYHVAPNSTVALWDSENQVIYLKSADMTGKPSMKYIDYTVRETEPAAPAADYVTKGDFERFVRQIEEKLEPKTVKKSVNRSFGED